MQHFSTPKVRIPNGYLPPVMRSIFRLSTTGTIAAAAASTTTKSKFTIVRRRFSYSTKIENRITELYKCAFLVL